MRGHDDGSLRAGDLAHAVVERADRESVDAARGHLLADIRAERAVHRLVRVGRRPEGERDLLHLGDRHHRAEDAAHQREEVNLAGDEHLERGRVAARDLVVLGEDLRFDAAARLRADGRPHLGEPPVQRTRGGLVVVLDEAEVGGAKRARKDERWRDGSDEATARNHVRRIR
jgi:hypothetical protein